MLTNDDLMYKAFSSWQRSSSKNVSNGQETLSAGIVSEMQPVKGLRLMISGVTT